VVARLYTSAKTSDEDMRMPPTYAGSNSVHWLNDNRRIAFLWTDGEGPNQVVVLDLVTGKLEKLTSHPTAIREFAISGDGKTVSFLALYSDRRVNVREKLSEGFAVELMDVDLLLTGRWDPEIGKKEAYIAQAPTFESRPLFVDSKSDAYATMPAEISFNGRWAITTAGVGQIPQEWDHYKDPTLAAIMDVDRARPEASITRTLRLVELETGSVRGFWEAPMGQPSRVLWSQDNRSVVIGPAFIPVDQADADGLHGRAVVEVDTLTGRFRKLPVPTESGRLFRPVRWPEGSVLELSDEKGESLFMRKHASRWHAFQSIKRMDRVRLEFREGLNSPPALFATDPKTGRTRMILDPEPRLRGGFKLGRAENIEWRDRDGRNWQGRLYYPVDYVAGRQYPLVVQTHGGLIEDNTFLLTGNLDVTGTSYAAQALANRGMMVLTTKERGEALRDDRPDEPVVVMNIYESAVEHLKILGLIDASRVGILGYSRSGWWVEYSLAHSKVDYAAAIVADNMELSYGQYLYRVSMRSGYGAMAGAHPVGEGLQTWFAHAPGFNVHKIRTPLRMERDQFGLIGILGHWEMFSMLRQLDKPVEMYVIPDSELGVHPLQMPHQKFASQSATVDWMDFWLNGREDPDPTKADQYKRWRKLRAQQERVIAQRRAAGEQVADLPPLQTLSSYAPTSGSTAAH
jgi:dipeptidyl aminopeptidase/acylaminoacyl peptidase